MNCAINTDASFSKTHQKGAFAFWIVCNNFRILKCGALKKKCSRSEIAEFQCIINALHVLSNEDCKQITRIIINTDCLNVIHLAQGDTQNIKKYKLASWGRDLVLTMKTLISKRGLSKIPIEFRHVKAHTNASDARSYVNDWCDKNAKAELNKLINRK